MRPNPRFLAPAAVAIAVLTAAPPAHALLNLSVTAEQSTRTVLPGETNVVLLTIAIDNTYTFLGGPRFLRSLRLTNTTAGPGSVADRDAELGSVRLHRDVNGNGVIDLPQDALVANSAAVSGAVVFASINESCPINTVTRFIVATDVPAVARDGDDLDVSIQASGDLTWDQSAAYANTFPISPGGSFPIDGMTRFQIGVGPSGSGSLLAGTTDNLVLNVVLPANGYEADLLQQLAIVNLGTAQPGSDITALKVWVDNGNASFAPASDRLLGVLAFTGAQRWQVTGLAEPMPRSGLRLFVSADLNDFAIEGRTLQPVLPTLPDPGVGVASPNDGPIDIATGATVPRAISTANRITLVAPAVAPATVRPGQSGVMLLQISAGNSYATPQTLDRLDVTNAGVGGTIAQRDHAIQSLTLRLDGDADGVLDAPATDPLLGSTIFADGQAAFTGIGHVLPAGVTRRLFVVADVSVSEAADGDTLSARVDGPSDVRFDDTTRVVASWPLDSHARAGVDGMVAAQLTLVAPPATTLAPGDSNMVAFDVRIPRNGWSDDLLQRIELVQQGTAAPGDLAELRLWRDGGDGLSTPGAGDDVDLGAAVWTGTRWQSAPLLQPLGAAGARVFAVVRVAAAPTDGVTLRLAVPVDGITVASGDDGPIDGPLVSPTTILISNSPLLASLAIVPAGSTIGQTVTAAMAVRNTGGESIDGVTASALIASGPGSLTPVSGPTPATLDLAAGASDTIRWTYSAAGAGDLRLTGHAQGTGSPSGTPRQSLDATSNLHRVFDPVASLDAAITTSLPVMVNRGQTGVVPITLHLSTAAGPAAAPVRLLALRVRLEDEPGAGIVPDQLLARVAVHEGATERLARTTLESGGDEIDLTLASPAVIDAGETVDLTLSIDLKTATTVSAFRMEITGATWLVAEDANNGAAIPVQLTSGSFPVRTGLARVVEAPVRLDVTTPAALERHAGPGQVDVPLLTLRFTTPGVVGITNDARVTALAFDADDTLGVQLARLADILGWIRLRTAVQTLASRGVFTSDGASLTLLLSPALSVPVNTPIDLFVSGDVSAAAGARAFRLRLADSTRVDARDAVTQDRVPVVMTADPLPGPPVVIELPADTVRVAGTPRMPPSVRAGDPGVTALSVRLHHPGGPGTAPLRVDSLVLLSRDEARRPLVPAQYLDRVRVLWNGVEAGAENDPPATGEATRIATPGRTIVAGDSATLDVVVDFAAVAPEGLLELWMFADGLHAVDANLGAPATVAPLAAPLPLFSGLTRIQAPARVLTAGLASTMPAALAADGREIPSALVTLTNTADPGAGDIRVDRLTVRASDRDFAALPLGVRAERVVAWVDGAPWAASATLTSDSTTATLFATTPLAIAADTAAVIELRFVARAGAAEGTLRLGLDAAGVGVMQPGSALLQIAVLAAPGQAFTLWTEAGSLAALDLLASYSNFPNPFAAGREVTHFAYYLAAPGRAWLKVMTLAGETVATVVDGDARGAGLQQNDLWDGRNGDGRAVRNGVYVAELLVHYDDGTRSRVLRKVAVVR